jgi:cellulose synthase/poly-beta-1,6-N-acetylglucosamine synthase-like glycosyltransferase
VKDSRPESFQLKTVTVPEAGVVAALNAGLAAASGEIVAITDDDAVPTPDWIARLECLFATDQRIGGVGGRDWVHEAGGIASGGRTVVGRVSWYGRVVGNHHLGVGGPREVDVLKGVNMSFRRRALESIRLDERLWGQGAQPHWEIPLSLAVKRRGWKVIYDPAAAVDHYPAERHGPDQRWWSSQAALRDAVHNETYALLRWLPWWQKIATFLYGIVVGTRQAPGLVTATERLFRGGDPRAVGKRVEVAMEARFQGLATFMRAWRGQGRH